MTRPHVSLYLALVLFACGNEEEPLPEFCTKEQPSRSIPLHHPCNTDFGDEQCEAGLCTYQNSCAQPCTQDADCLPIGDFTDVTCASDGGVGFVCQALCDLALDDPPCPVVDGDKMTCLGGTCGFQQLCYEQNDLNVFMTLPTASEDG